MNKYKKVLKKTRPKKVIIEKDTMAVPIAPAPPKMYAKGKLGKVLGGVAGEALGGLVGSFIPGMSGAGSFIGRGIGKTIGKYFRNVTGMGEYHINKNTILNSDNSPPTMHNDASYGYYRVRHREYIADVTTSATANTFKTQSYYINPALPNLFPWLSMIAQNFQEFRFQGLVFEFKSTSSDALNSTNTALGTVIMATQYNSNQIPFSTKRDMENSEYCVSGKPSLNHMHPIECDPSQTPIPNLYVYKPSISTAINDARFFNLGNFQIATTGFQGTSINIGELWVTYDIILMKPIQGGRSFMQGDHWQLNSASVSTSAYLGTNTLATLSTDSDLGTALASNNSITFNANFSGIVSVTYLLIGSSTALGSITLTGSNGVTANNIVFGDTANSAQNGSTTATVYMHQSYWNVTPLGNGSLPTISITGSGALPSGISYGDLIISTVQNTI